jgi:hypothetical protein
MLGCKAKVEPRQVMNLVLFHSRLNKTLNHSFRQRRKQLMNLYSDSFSMRARLPERFDPEGYAWWCKSPQQPFWD